MIVETSQVCAQVILSECKATIRQLKWSEERLLHGL